MLQLYRDVAALAVKRGVRAWPAALAIPIYGAILIAAVLLAQGLGQILGSLLMLVVGVACLASYLGMLADAVAGSKLRLADMQRWKTRFWDVWSVSFALFLIGLGLSLVVKGAGDRGRFVIAGAELLGAVFFNVIPELLYLGQKRSFGLLKESIDFIQANAFSWLLPNILFALALLAASGLLTLSKPALIVSRLPGLLSPGGFITAIVKVPLWAIPLIILFIHFAMVFRGVLFGELSSGSPRQRAYKRQITG